MSGTTRLLIDKLIDMRTKGDRSLVAPIKIKLIMKGIDPDMFDESTPDNPAVIQRVKSIAKEMGFEL